jgi:SnoaL-like domain
VTIDSASRETADRVAIAGVLHRYARGLDTFDAEVTASCFTDDCRYHLGDHVIVGRGALLDVFADRTGVRKRETGLDPIEAFTHPMSNIEVWLDGDRARAESMVTAYVVGRRGSDQVMLVRCVRYYDRLVRVGDEWSINERHHVLQWSYEATPTFVLPAAAPVD